MNWCFCVTLYLMKWLYDKNELVLAVNCLLRIKWKKQLVNSHEMLITVSHKALLFLIYELQETILDVMKGHEDQREPLAQSPWRIGLLVIFRLPLSSFHPNDNTPDMFHQWQTVNTMSPPLNQRLVWHSHPFTTACNRSLTNPAWQPIES